MSEINFDDFEEINDDESQFIDQIKEGCLKMLSIIENHENITHPNLPEAAEFVTKATNIMAEIEESQVGSRREKSRGELASKEIFINEDFLQNHNVLDDYDLDDRQLTPKRSQESIEVKKENPLNFLEKFITPELNNPELNNPEESKSLSRNILKVLKSKEQSTEVHGNLPNKKESNKEISDKEPSYQYRPSNNEKKESAKIKEVESEVEKGFNIEDFETHNPTIPTQRKEFSNFDSNFFSVVDKSNRLSKKFKEFKKMAVEKTRGNFHGDQAKKKLDYYFESLRAINNLHKQMYNPSSALDRLSDSYKAGKQRVMTPILNRKNYKDYFDQNFLSKSGNRKSPMKSFEDRFARKIQPNNSQSSKSNNNFSPFSNFRAQPHHVSRQLDQLSSDINRNKLRINLKLYS